MSPMSQSLTESQKDHRDLFVQLKLRYSFPAIIRIAFGNEVLLTTKLISSFERATFLQFFELSFV